MGFGLVLFRRDSRRLFALDGIRIFGTQSLMAVGILPLAGQFVWMLLSQGPGNLLPLGVIVFGVLSIPPIIAAWIGAFIATKTAKTR